MNVSSLKLGMGTVCLLVRSKLSTAIDFMPQLGSPHAGLSHAQRTGGTRGLILVRSDQISWFRRGHHLRARRDTPTLLVKMEATAEYLSLAEAFRVYVLQVPTYHLIFELVLVAGIVTLYFSKSFGPRPKPAEKPTREVSVCCDVCRCAVTCAGVL